MSLRWMVRRPSVGRFAVVPAAVALTTAWFVIGAPVAVASPDVPSPGSPGSLAFPEFSPGTFASPPAATRVKFRLWQPVADTNDGELQREVNAMAGNFGGGFEQNGFAVSNEPQTVKSGRCDGCTSQFTTYAASQQFGQQFGWGSPMWSHSNEVYQQAAAQNGVIGDMTEGSRWDNTVPTVYSPNQEADAQDLSYGGQQYQPGQDPSGELPPVTSPAPGGESTRLSAQANPGDANIRVQSVAGLLAGDQLSLGAGTAAETATIKSVGTASPAVPLSQAAAVGSTVIHLAPADTTTGVPGTAQAAAQFVPGEDVTVGSGASTEQAVIAGIGTYDMATSPTTLVPAPDGSGTIAAPAGSTNVEVASNANLLKGDTITIGSGSGAESRKITSVGGAGSGTTLSAATSAGDLQISAGLPVPTYTGAHWLWNTAGSASGAAAGTIFVRRDFTLTSDQLADLTDAALRINADDGQFTYVNGTQVSSSSSPNWPISQLVNIKPYLRAGDNVIAVAPNNGGGAGGMIAAVQLDFTAAAGVPGNQLLIHTEHDGTWLTSDETGAACTDTPANCTSNAAEEPANNPGSWTEPEGTTGDTFNDTSWLPMFDTGAYPIAPWNTLSNPSGSGLSAGQFITIGQGSSQEVDRIATVSDHTLTLYTPLQHPHASADPLALKSLGVTFTPALSRSHPVGDSAIDTGTGITLRSPLSKDHAAGDTFTAPGTGVTFTAPLAKTHLAGPNNATATALSATAAAGATNVKIASVNNLAAGDQLTIGQPGYTETVTIQDVGTTGATGTGATFSPALARFHYSGDPAVDATNVNVTNASGGVSDIEKESLVRTEFVQCLPPNVADPEVAQTTSLSAAAAAGASTITVGSASNLAVGDQVTVGAGGAAETRVISAISGKTVTLTSPLSNAHPSGEPAWDTCTSAPTGGTRQLDPATAIDVTHQVTPNKLSFTSGSLGYHSLPVGNGQPWELIDFYLHGDTQTNSGGTATTPNQWLGHLSVASAKAMTDYFDNNILNDPATRAAIAYQDAHNGTPAVFEDSLENSNNLNWVPDMISSWHADLGYDPTSLLPALAATGRNATSAPAFDFPQSDGQGATLGWRIRDDYAQMWNDLYINRYVKTVDDWAASRGLVARFQPYGDPIDAGEAAANIGIAESEHLETAGQDETQQLKVVASGTYQTSTPHLLSDECCEADAQVWADPFGINGTGTGSSPDATENNAQSVYADQAGGASQIVYHGWPYTIGPAGARAVWPGNSYGGNASYAAANGPNQPQFADDRNNNIAAARHGLTLRQGEPSFDVAVFHEDFGATGQGQDNLTNGWNMGTVTANGVTTRPTSGKLLRSSSSLAQAGYLYGYVSPAFFRYSSATFAKDPNDPGASKNVLFPGYGDYKALVLYDQSVMPVDVAQKLAALAGKGLPIVIIGQVPNAAPNASGGTVAGMSTADTQVQTAMAKVIGSPTTKIVADATAAGSQSADGNASDALVSLGITASTQMNTASAVNAGGVATPVLGVRRHDDNVDYYQLFNMSNTTTVHPSVTLSGNGIPYLLDAWTGKITPIANYTATGNRVTLSLRIGPGNATMIGITPSNNVFKAKPEADVHATGTTANATQAGTDNVVYDSSGDLVARASTSGTYTTSLSDGTRVTSDITVPAIDPGSTVSVIGGVPTLTNWQVSVDSWTQTPSGDPTQTLHTPIPATGTLTVSPLNGVSNGALPAWTAITPQNVPGLDPANNLTNVAGIGTYTTSFTLPANWSRTTAGAYLNVGAAVDTVDVWVNGKAVSSVDENDRNQVDIGPYLQAGSNDLKISVATPLRNAVAIAPATPATGQVPNSAETIGDLQGGNKIANVGLIGPVTLTPYGQSGRLN